MVQQFNYPALAKRVDKILLQYGRPDGATAVRRNGTDYPVRALEANFYGRNRDQATPMRRDTVSLLLSVENLPITPNEETDVIVFLDTGQELEIVAPPKRTAPGGVNIFWQLECKER